MVFFPDGERLLREDEPVGRESGGEEEADPWSAVLVSRTITTIIICFAFFFF